MRKYLALCLIYLAIHSITLFILQLSLFDCPRYCNVACFRPVRTHIRLKSDGSSEEEDIMKPTKYLIKTSQCKILDLSSHSWGLRRPGPRIYPEAHFEFKSDRIVRLTTYGEKKYRNCCMRALFRVERRKRIHFNCDWQTRFTACKAIEPNGTKSISPYVRVDCINRESNHSYVDFASTAIPPEVYTPRTAAKASFWKNNTQVPRPPNVIFLGINGVSRVHMIRSLEETRAFALKNDFIELKGFTKIGMSNHANMMAMLQGAPFGKHGCSRNPQRHPFDTCPFIWKDFSRLNYMTALVEDSPSLSMFNYQKVGFCKRPVDYYHRTVMAAAQDYLKGMRGLRLPRNFFNGLNSFDLIFNFIHTFIQEVGGKYPYFLVSGFRTVHGGVMEIANDDGKFHHLLHELIHNETYNGNNTLIILHSTHGVGYYTAFKSYFEEALPMMLIRIPPTLKNSHPDWYKNLKTNSARLTTSTDIYDTVKDIFKIASNQSSRTLHSNSSSEKSKYSLFEQIPENRTCESAAIPGQHCRCGFIPIMMSDTNLSSWLSQAIINHINQMMTPVMGQNLCIRLVLGKYVYGRVLNEGSFKDRFGETFQFVDYRVAVEAYPSGGIFEADLRHTDDDSLKIIGNVRRINGLKNQSYCIREKKLKPFCCCQDASIKMRIGKIKEYMKWTAYAVPTDD